MNFDVSKSSVIPFAITEHEVKNFFWDFLADGENVPVDIGYKANIIQIKKTFYPVRCFDVQYSAEWSATSIWEHKEQYTEYITKTVYYDWEGKEHNRPGTDYTDSTGKWHKSKISSEAVARPWRPAQKVEPVTKYKTVTDNVEQTYGNIGNYRSFQPVITYENASDKGLSEWVIDIPIKSNYIPVKNEFLDGCEIRPLLLTDQHAKNTAMTNIKDLATRKCKSEVPGNRYADLSVQTSLINCAMSIVLIPVYNISYEYNGQKFEYWQSGIIPDKLFYNTKPQDNDIAKVLEQFEGTIKRNGTRRLFWGLVSFLVMPFIVITALAMTIDSSPWAYVWLSIIALVLSIIRFKKIGKKNNELKQRKENYVVNLKDKRLAIINIMKNETMNDSDKKAEISRIMRT